MLTRNQWIEELRSGKWQQWRGSVSNSPGYADANGTAFCCLGVACVAEGDYPEMTRDVYNHLSTEFLTQVVNAQILEQKLICLNDSAGFTFAQIADWVEANTPEEVQ